MREFVKQIFVMRECVKRHSRVTREPASLMARLRENDCCKRISKVLVSGTRPGKCLHYSKISMPKALLTRNHYYYVVKKFRELLGGVIVKLIFQYLESVICNYFTRACVIPHGYLVPPMIIVL